MNQGPALSEAELVAAVNALGEKRVQYDDKAEAPSIVGLNLGFTKVTDAQLKHLAVLKNLKSLNLNQTQVTDIGMKELIPIKNLQILTLQYTNVTDAGLKDLATIKSLKSLDLVDAKLLMRE